MSILTYLKIAVAAALLLGAWHLGGDHARAQLAAEQLALAKASAAAVDAQGKKIRAVENSYDALKDMPDPVVAGVTTRLRLIAGAIPDAPLAGRTQGACPQPASLERLKSAVGGVTASLGRYVQACSDDAKQLNAVIGLAP